MLVLAAMTERNQDLAPTRSLWPVSRYPLASLWQPARTPRDQQSMGQVRFLDAATRPVC
jgi:hypothetical protein